MKIKDNVVERDCCDVGKDIAKLILTGRGITYFFCRHCGQIWQTEDNKQLVPCGYPMKDENGAGIPWPESGEEE